MKQGRIIIYQVLTRLWKNGKLSDWGKPEFDYLKSLGVDYIWYTGIPRHETGKSYVKGDPGSPYSIADYYDINPYLADRPENRMAEFSTLVDRTHKAGLKLLTDFIPNHLSPDYKGDIPVHPYYDYDWSDTRKINYDDPRTFDAMTDVVLFWAGKGVDGMRCDMVELVRSDFFSYMISKVHETYPDFLFVAEVYGKENYRKYIEAGFDLLYDKSGLYDILCRIINEFESTRQITWNWQWLSDLQGNMLNFLENHDEKRHIINCPAALAVSALFNNASFMIYFGQEFGEDASDTDNQRTSIFNWARKIKPSAVLPEYKEIMRLASKEPFKSGLNYDLCYCQGEGFDQDRHFAFLRYNESEKYLVVCNFSGLKAKINCRFPEGNGNIEVDVDAWGATIVKLTN